MERVAIAERPDWRKLAAEWGFVFHTMDGEPYWDESAYWRFSLAEIETGFEAAGNELHQLCLDVIDRATRDSALMEALRIPPAYWDYIARSWTAKDPALYGRFDFSYDGRSPPKLLEYNADTPTALYESGVFQWVWLEQRIADRSLASGADQFNAVHERLIARFKAIADGEKMHFASVRDAPEDRGTVAYLEDCAQQGGVITKWLAIDDIGAGQDGAFYDVENEKVDRIFKLYPWEWMLREAVGPKIPASGARFIEPPWKALLSNKGLLPLLWRFHPRHPNLLPAYFAGEEGVAELGDTYVVKPIFSREGANVTIVKDGLILDRDDGPYGQEGVIYQAYAPLPEAAGRHALFGVWMIGEEASGLCVREGDGAITKNSARFLPHVIL